MGGTGKSEGQSAQAQHAVAHLRHDGSVERLEAEGEVRENHFVARVSAESKAAIGQSVELAFDTTKLVVFDADSGVNLTVPVSASE